MAPHIFRIGAEAHEGICTDSRNQCVIVTGESGAGKTEAAKQLMRFVTMVGISTEAQKATMEGVKRHLLESNPVLESFGNARTIRNDNSSRFGKYMEMQFTFKGVIQGGRVTNYLLEKSRVTSQAPGERSFHIFYYLLQGATEEEKERYGLLWPREYEFLMKEERIIPGVDDAEEFPKLKEAMLSMGIKREEQCNLFKLLSGVLATGNVTFQDHGDGNRATVMDRSPEGALHLTAKMMGVDAEALEKALTTATLVV
ncbi:unnamed protein product, partial [Discosporangium mesarthrocarpum]